jgi:two-component system OmpR family sensor kinase
VNIWFRSNSINGMDRWKILNRETQVMTEDPIARDKVDQGTADDAFFRTIDVEFLIHELKDPMSVIETAVRMLLEKPAKYGPLTDRQDKTLKRALRNAKKARSMLADLLEVGRSDAGCFQCCRFDPVSAIDEVFLEVLEAVDADLWEWLQEIGPGPDRIAALKRHGIHLSFSNSLRSKDLCQDEAKFRQIVGNLIKNAFKHHRRRLDICVDCRDDRLVVDVVDDGPGVEKENRELIFTRYTRLNQCTILSRTGHGLGLAGARILARHLGGEITVKDHRGPGACFCLQLPLALKQPV